jgi:hypothetical protein
MELNDDSFNCREWTPVRVARDTDGPLVEWCYMGATRFLEPFFEDTIRKRLRLPFSLLFRRRTGIDVLGEFAESSPGIAPTGFIFHMSRCGSTLVSQMLAASSRNIVISEAPPIDHILRSINDRVVKEADDRRVNWLRWLLSAYGQRRNGTEQYLFIKFDSWSTIELELIERVFPNVPWIFLYRDPLEVLTSQVRQPGMQMIPGNLLTSRAASVPLSYEGSRERYIADVLEIICRSALKFANSKNGAFINYADLPFAFVSILKHFEVTFADHEIDAMNAVTKFNAKTPQMYFEPDSDKKRSEATQQMIEAAERLHPIYAQLESARLRRKAA